MQKQNEQAIPLSIDERAVRRRWLKTVWIRFHWPLMLAGLGVVALVLSTVPSAQALGVYEAKDVQNLFSAWLKNFTQSPFDRMHQVYKQFVPVMSGDLYGLLKNMQSAVTAIACTLVMIYMFMNIIREAQHGDPSMDFWTKIFVSSVVAIVVVSCTSTILSSLYKAGDALITSTYHGAKSAVQGQTAESAGLASTRNDLQKLASMLASKKGPEKLATALKKDKSSTAYKMVQILKELPNNENIQTILTGGSADYASLQGTGSVVELLLWISYVPLLATSFLMYSSVFELFIRKLFAPMAVANIAYDGARSSGVRYIKKYFACILRIAVNFALAAFGEVLMTFFLKSAMSAVSKGAGKDSLSSLILFGLSIMSELVAFMSMLQMGGMADEIVGA